MSTVGVSGLITPDGVVHDKSSLFTSKVLSGNLPLRTSTTVADRLGALPERLAVVAVMASFLLAAAGSRLRRRSGAPVTSNAKGHQLV